MGVENETLSPGDGQTFPKSDQTVFAHYTETLTIDTKFGSFRDRTIAEGSKSGMKGFQSTIWVRRAS